MRTIFGARLLCAAATLIPAFGIGAEAALLVRDIEPDPPSGKAAPMASFLPLLDSEGIMYFSAATDSEGAELWRSDGTREGTYLLADLSPGADSTLLAPDSICRGPLAGTVVVAYQSSNPAVPGRLIAVNGTTGATTTLFAGLASAPAYANGRVLFSGLGQSGRYTLHRTDGSAGGTQELSAVRPLSASGTPAIFRGSGNWLYFVGRGFDGFQETAANLWLTDGTQVQPLGESPFPNSPPTIFGFIGNRIVFGKDLDTGRIGEELYSAELGSTAPVLLKGFDGAGEPLFAGSGGGRIFVTMRDYNLGFGREPFATDGTPAGTHALGDFRPGPDESSVAYVGSMGAASFLAIDGSLVRTDGTAAGTASLGTFAGLAPSGEPGAGIGGRFCFFADDGEHGYEPWSTDGTSVSMIADLNPGAGGSLPGQNSPGAGRFHALGGRLIWNGTVQRPLPCPRRPLDLEWHCPALR